MNSDVFFVRVRGKYYAASEVDFIQVNPNREEEIVQDIPLLSVIARLINLQVTAFKRIPESRKELDDEARYRERLNGNFSG
jgi:hypothetical protein